MTTGRLRALRPVWGPLSALLLYTVLRLPSFAEPHWYTDEAGYVSVASSLLRGRVLYLQIWNNKPPLHLWSIAAVVKVFGSSEAALHGLTFISGALALGAVYWAGRRVLGPARASRVTVARVRPGPLADGAI